MKFFIKSWLTYSFILFFVFFFFHRLLFFQVGVLEKGASYIAYPFFIVQRVFVDAGKQIADFFTVRSVMRSHITDLEKKYASLQAEYISVISTYHFLQETNDLRAYAQRYKQEYMKTARVLHVYADDAQQYMYVSQGSGQGVCKDMVAVYANMLLGRVIEVYPWYSKIQLITDSCTKVGVITEKTRISGVFEGLNQEKVGAMKFVPHLQKPDMHELLISTGQGLVYPEGFGVGRITSIVKNGMYYDIAVEPLCNPVHIKYVMLLAVK